MVGRETWVWPATELNEWDGNGNRKLENGTRKRTSEAMPYSGTCQWPSEPHAPFSRSRSGMVSVISRVPCAARDGLVSTVGLFVMSECARANK